MRVLVVEDDADLARVVVRALRDEQFAVDLAPEGEEALFRAREVGYDAIVLDLLLPRLDGWTVLETVRREGVRTPVLVLTARDEVRDRVRGLDLGADDYLTKPFSLAELCARVRALIRRASADPSPVLTAGGITVETAARRVLRHGTPVELTAREYAVLELLVRYRGAVVTRTTIYEHIYDDAEETFSNVVDVYVAALRRKLGREIIQTRRGHGYIIEA